MQTHRPIKKVSRTPSILIMGVGLNVSVILIFYWGLEEFTMTPKLLPFMHQVLLWLSVIMLILVVPSVMISVALNPGYI
jgi:uncharacterized protein involved in cysteine biosynthesis